MTETVTWVEFYRSRRSYVFDTFVFVPTTFGWRDGDIILTSSEDVYDDDDVSECETPMELFKKGYRFLFTISEVRTAYDDTWVHFGGDDTIEWFNLSLQNYTKGLQAILPGDVAKSS